MTSWLGLLMSFARPTFVPVCVCVCPQPMLNWKFSNWQINSPLKYTQRIPWHRNDNKAPNETRNSQWKVEGGGREEGRERLFSRRPRRPHLHLVSTSWATLTYHQSYINVSAMGAAGWQRPVAWQTFDNCHTIVWQRWPRIYIQSGKGNPGGSHKGKI